MSNLLDEIEQMPDDELELIFDEQKDLYTAEELRLIELELDRRGLYTIPPNEIPCQKCDGINPYEYKKCKYCGAVIDKNDYRIRVLRNEIPEDTKLYFWEVLITVLFPYVGICIGLSYMLSPNHSERQSIGKRIVRACVIWFIIQLAIALISILVFNHM